MCLTSGLQVPSPPSRGESRSPEATTSICATCMAEGRVNEWPFTVPARIERREDGLWLQKDCPVHGITRERTWRDLSLAERLLTQEGCGGRSLPEAVNCPGECGRCERHQSYTAVVLVEVTHRCNLGCRTCFAKGGKNPTTDPSIEAIVQRLRTAKVLNRVPPKILQLIGGEPTLRDDLPEILRAARLSQCDLMKSFHVVLYGRSGSGSRPWSSLTRRTVCQETL